MVRAHTQRTHLLAYALAYANDGGWPVIPLRPGTKRPATPNHTAETCDRSDPRCNSTTGHQGWEQRALTDPGRIHRTWNQTPYGVGIACGPAGLVVIDLDTGNGISGADSLAQLERDHGHQLPATFTVATPSGGRHLYYRRPPGTTIRNSAGTLAPGIDIRAAGGYVVAPPTITTAGSYEVIDDTWPPTLPDWFSQLLDPPTAATPARPKPKPVEPSTSATADRVDRYVTAAVDGELARLANAGAGRRNHSLFCAAVALGQLVAAGALDRPDVEQLLERTASPWYGIPGRKGGDPFTPTEARAAITSGLRRGLNEPRQLPTAADRRTPIGATR